jgi:hypothetical protein
MHTALDRSPALGLPRPGWLAKVPQQEWARRRCPRWRQWSGGKGSEDSPPLRQKKNLRPGRQGREQWEKQDRRKRNAESENHAMLSIWLLSSPSSC